MKKITASRAGSDKVEVQIADSNLPDVMHIQATLTIEEAGRLVRALGAAIEANGTGLDVVRVEVCGAHDRLVVRVSQEDPFRHVRKLARKPHTHNGDQWQFLGWNSDRYEAYLTKI